MSYGGFVGEYNSETGRGDPHYIRSVSAPGGLIRGSLDYVYVVSRNSIVEFSIEFLKAKPFFTENLDGPKQLAVLGIHPPLEIFTANYDSGIVTRYSRDGRTPARSDKLIEGLDHPYGIAVQR